MLKATLKMKRKVHFYLLKRNMKPLVSEFRELLANTKLSIVE